MVHEQRASISHFRGVVDKEHLFPRHGAHQNAGGGWRGQVCWTHLTVVEALTVSAIVARKLRLAIVTGALDTALC